MIVRAWPLQLRWEGALGFQYSMRASQRPHVKATVPEVEQRACSVEQRRDHPLPHVEALVSRVLNSVHEDVAFLRVSMEVDIQQHLPHNTNTLTKSGINNAGGLLETL